MGGIGEQQKPYEDKVGRPCLHFAAHTVGYLLRRRTGVGSWVRHDGDDRLRINKPPISPLFLKRWEVASPCPGEAFEKRLKQLEEEVTTYRVLIVIPECRPSDHDLVRMAQYDVILSLDVKRQSRLVAQGLTCLTGQSGSCPVLDCCDLAKWLAKRLPPPSNRVADCRRRATFNLKNGLYRIRNPLSAIFGRRLIR